MRRILLLLLPIALFLSFCGSKENDPSPIPEPPIVVVPTAKKYPVSFSVSSLDHTFKKIAATEAPATSDKIDVLYYILYNPDGTLNHTIIQKNTDTNFGSIKDSLVAGDYTVAIVGYKGTLKVEPLIASTGRIEKDFYKPIVDTFIKKFPFTVGGSSNQSVVLERVIAQAQFVIKDAIPANVAKLEIKVNDELLLYAFEGEVGPAARQPLIVTVPIGESDRGKTGFTYSLFILNTQAKVDITIRAFSSSNDLIATQSIPQVQFYKNTTTVLSGDLFDAGKTFASPFTVTVNYTWNPIKNEIPF